MILDKVEFPNTAFTPVQGSIQFVDQGFLWVSQLFLVRSAYGMKNSSLPKLHNNPPLINNY